MEPVELVIDAVWVGQQAVSAAENAIKGVLDVCGKLTEAAVKVGETLLRNVVAALQAVAQAAVTTAGVLTGALLSAMTAVGTAGVEMHTSVNRASMALQQITGSAQGAAEILRGVKEESLTSALTFKELIPIAQSLAAAYAQIYGGQGVASRVRPAIRAFGDAAVATGADEGAQARALLGFRQLVTSDTVKQQDLRQISENLPGSGITSILRKQFGTADTETLQQAKVTGAQVGEAIVAGLQQSFGGFQQKLASTDIGIILSNFQDAFNNLAQEVTNRFSPQLSAALSKVLDLVQSLSTNQGLISALAVPFDLLGQAVSAAAEHLPEFVGWIEKIATRENVVDLIASIAAGFQTFGDEVQKFLTAVTGGRSFETIWQAFADAGGKALDFVYKSWNVLVAAIQFFSDNAGTIFGVVADAIKPIGDWLNVAIAKTTVLIQMAQQALGQFGGGFKSGLGGSSGTPVQTAGMGGFDNPMGGGGGGGLAGIVLGTDWGRRALGWLTGQAVGNGMNALGVSPSALSQQGFPDIGQSWQKSNIGGRLSGLGADLQGRLTHAAGASLGDFGVTYQGYRQGDKAGINGFLAGGQVPGQPNGDTGPGIQAQGAAAPTQKEIEKAIAARNAYFDAMTTRAHSLSEMIGGGSSGGAGGGGIEQAQRAVDAAVLEVKQVLPILQIKQQDIVSQLRLLSPQTEEYWKLVREQYHLQDEMQRMSQKGIQAQRGLDKVLQEEGVKTIDAQADLAKAQIEGNPAFVTNAAARMKAVIDRLIPIQIQKFQTLVNTQIEGEDESAIFRRMQQAESLRGEINKELGVGDKNVLHTLGADPAGALPAQRALNRFGRYMSPRDRKGLMEMIQHSGGGVMGLWNEGRVKGVNQQLDSIMNGSVSMDRLHSPDAIWGSADGGGGFGGGGGGYSPRALYHGPLATDLEFGGNLNPTIRDVSTGAYPVGGGSMNSGRPRAQSYDGAHSVVFAPQVNAAPDPEALRATMLQLVDELLRQAFPGTSVF